MASVSEESPASKAGLKAGDIILEFDGKKIETMRTLPKAVANTEVGKNVVIKIWRNKNLISKKLKLGRLESSKEFKEGKKKKETEKKKEVEVETLKIVVRDLTEDDITKRNLAKGSKGVMVVEVSNRSPLSRFISVNNIILEIQKTSITSNSINEVVKNIIKKGEQTILLTVINNNNQRRYLGVKIN